jgi:hypothetical protein
MAVFGLVVRTRGLQKFEVWDIKRIRGGEALPGRQDAIFAGVWMGL